MAECFNIYIEDISCNGKGQIENLALLHILKGDTGDTGLSAYELALQIGYIGTLEEWIASLKGEQGEQGDKGEQGLQGIQGIQGEQGYTPYVGENGNWFINGIDTNIHAQGLKGDKGDKGDNSFSPYIDPNTLTWWQFNDTTKIYEDTGISVNDFLKKDGSIPLNSGYLPTIPLAIATKDYVDKQVTLYNITNEIPLPAGNYYTLTTAIAAVPSALRKIGFEITFESSAGVWETYQFKGVIANWSVLASWELVPNKKYVDDLIQEVKVIDTKQDNQIKEIEELLSTSNLNQNTTNTSTGYEEIALPKTAANGGMEIKLEGQTAENLVVNGDFRDGIANWIGYNSILTSGNNTLYALGNGMASIALVYQDTTPIISNNKIYIKVKARVTNTLCNRITIIADCSGEGTGIYNVDDINTPLENQWYKLSGIATYTTQQGYVRVRVDSYYSDAATQENKIMELQDYIAVNLTEIFGAGNEPDLATCDKIFADYFDGVKTFIPTGRLKSIGKNIADTNEFKKFKPIIDFVNIQGRNCVKIPANGIGNSLRLFNDIFLKNNQYSLRCDLMRDASTVLGIPILFTLKDGTYSGIQVLMEENVFLSYEITSTPTKDVDFLIINWMEGNIYIDLDTLQIERNATATSFEPYLDQNFYLNAPNLRSNGLVKDEIRKGVNGYELVQRISADIEITGYEDWIIDNESSNINNIAFKYDFGNILDNAINNVIKSNKFNYYSIDYLYFNDIEGIGYSDTYVGEGNYIMIKISRSKLSSQDSAGFKLWLQNNFVTFNYNLITPEVTPIAYSGILNSHESGTIYHEPVVADAGVYDTNIEILMVDYPISTIETIIKHENGIDTYLDINDAVIALDGLSFTHPDLVRGDLVLFTYFFDLEKVNGLITATYFDSRFVIADSVNNKFYKWSVVSANGVPSINLIEV